ncbi:MAG: sulfite exporter TauE/SafE family protein [Candidatus Gracilibacteria bacterium]
MKYTFHVAGTHCASCKILIEDILSEEKDVKNVNVDIKKETVEIETESQEDPQILAQTLTDKIKSNGYTLFVEKPIKKNEQDDLIWKAIPIGFAFLILFFILQKSGILNFGIGGKTTLATSFIIGLIASVSSCLAVVGGLVLSLSAKISQDKISDTKTFVLFHAGRLLSFGLLGGVLGLIGNAIGINFIFSMMLGVLASLIMIFLGLNLLGIFAKNKLTLHSGFFNFFKKIEHKTLTPLMVGFGTFFLPCGFTQSMQTVALSSGSFLSGALTMLVFAFGTLPMLVLLSFGAGSFAHSKHAPLFLKSAGVVVIGLGTFTLLAGLAGIGIIKPIFNI